MPSTIQFRVGRAERTKGEFPRDGRDLNGARRMQALPWDFAEDHGPRPRPMVFLIRGPAYLPMPLDRAGLCPDGGRRRDWFGTYECGSGRDLVVVEARGSTGVAGGRGTQSD